MKGQSRAILWSSISLAFVAFLFWAPQNGTSVHAAVISLPPGEDMAVPGEPKVTPPVEPPKGAKEDQKEVSQPPAQLGKVRIAVSGDDASRLAGLIGHDAPFEIVKLAADPDLIWDPASHGARSGSAVIAYGVELSGLAAVIDRTAALRELGRLAAAHPQSIKLTGGNGLRKKGERIEIVVDDVANRALLLADIAGDGVTQLLYPAGADTRMPKSSPYKHALLVTQPFGTDVIVAITSANPIGVLEDRLKDPSHTMTAAEFLTLVSQQLPPDAHMGLLTLTTAP
jgi:hypothetical protein